MLTSTTKERLLLSSALYNVFFFILISSLTAISHAESERVDFDLDNDGLIEINDLADLDEIRNHPDGKALYGKNVGCPDAEDGTVNGGCFGFELTTDLDFDTNQDGEISELDAYWNEGKGWAPSRLTKATFNGNGFSIKNLYIDRASQERVAFFSTITNATITDLALTGINAQVTGGHITAGLAGWVENSSISRVAIAISIRGRGAVSGVIGMSYSSDVSHALIAGKFRAQIVGFAHGFNYGSSNDTHYTFVTSTLDNNTSDSYFTEDFGLWYSGSPNTLANAIMVGRLPQHPHSLSLSRESLSNSEEQYWKDGNGFKSFFWANDTGSYPPSNFQHATIQSTNGLPLSYFMCNPMDNLVQCQSDAIYSNPWITSTNSAGNAIWDFGNNNQLPGINLNGNIYRDSDGDGVLDRDDEFPNNWEASMDFDKDGYPDKWHSSCGTECIQNSQLKFDSFPKDFRLAIDHDLDGLPDFIDSEKCDSKCVKSLGITVDAHPNDFDNDGLNDLVDPDDDNNGIPDIDLDSDGLIDIRSIKEFNAIRFQLDGYGYRKDSESKIDSSGCPPSQVTSGDIRRVCRGYELVSDIDFDTNHNGVFDGEDEFWNDGKGWEPIGSSNNPFTAVFRGNQYTIKNVVSDMDRNTNSRRGLFSVIKNSKFDSLKISEVKIYDNYRWLTWSSGTLAGEIYNSHISKINVSGHIETASFSTGGLAGSARNTVIESSSFKGSIHGVMPNSYSNSSKYQVGGLLGSASLAKVKESAVFGKISSYPQQSDSIYSLGGILGSGNHSSIESTSFSGHLNGHSAGGVVGRAGDQLSVINSFMTGSVIASKYAGGIIASGAPKYVKNSYTVSVVSGFENRSGPLCGYQCENRDSSIEEFQESYWSFGLPYIEGFSSLDHYHGQDISILKCSESNDSTCLSSTIFSNWKNELNSNSEPLWNFGKNNQLPALNILGTLIRDSDGDGTIDSQDQVPNHWESALDTDNDQRVDSWNIFCDETCRALSVLQYDYFPYDKNISIDTDLDGHPEGVNEDICDEACLEGYWHLLDTSLSDSDNDFIPDDIDTDDNNDGILDIDADSDGLVDVKSLYHFSSIRFQLNGHGLKVSESDTLQVSGCPIRTHNGVIQRLCFGYELIGDIDFDTNQDGFVDQNDQLWNEGKGWIPIGDRYNPFTGLLDGNGHRLKNFYVNNTDYSRASGIFSDLLGAEIKNVVLSGPNSKFEGSRYGHIGALSGRAEKSSVSSIFTTSEVFASYRQDIGGLFGYAADTSIENVFSSGIISSSNVSEYGARGGLIGEGYNIEIDKGVVVGEIDTNQYSGAFLGEFSIYGDITLEISDSYWAEDSTSTNSVYSRWTGQNTLEGATNAKLDELICGTPIRNWSCSSKYLFNNWKRNIWDFGTTDQLPGLVFGDRVIRDSDGDRLLDEEDEFPLVSIIGYTDTDSDGAPDTCNSVCQASGMSADLDSDNDGVPNTQDQKPLISHRWLEDLDKDGLPNKCESECLGWGLTEDLDDDGDNVPDEQDFYSLISLNGLTDSDQDGIPNKCDLGCIALGMSEDLDDDNDSIPDTLDGFPEVAIGELTDTDGDGRPDECDDACLALGMKADDDDDNDQVADGIDKFPLDPTENLDTDLDGIGNNADTDDDNDGVLDELDPDINQDNGKPTLTKAPVNRELSADESGVTVTIDSIDLLNELAAIDALDANPTFKAFFDSQTVYLNQVESITLNTGLNTIHWYAMDESGNLSEPQTQTIKVYPKVGFVSEKVVTGETSEASIAINLSGESPIYPIDLTVAIDVANTTVTQNDFVQGQFDLTANHIVSIEKQEGRLQNTHAELIIPLLRDLEVEQEEVLTLKLIAVHSGNLELPLIQITDSHKKMELVVTDENLPPSLDIEVFQGGQKINDEEVIVDISGGQLDFKASSIDPNGDLVHFEWKLEGLTMDLKEDTTTWSMDPSRFLENESYALEVTAIDSSDSSIRTTIKLDFKAIDSANDNLDEEEEAIGSANALWLLMLFSLFRKRGIYKK